MDDRAAVLVVDADSTVRRETAATLSATFRVVEATGVQQAIGALETTHFDAVLADVMLRPLDGYALLNWVRSHHPDVPVVLTATDGSMQTIVRAIHGGAHEFLHKPAGYETLVKTMQRAARKRDAAAAAAAALGVEDPGGMLGASPHMVEVYRLVARAARSAAPVLIQGESGTGKELVARAIHEHGERRGKPVLAVNCGALTDTLLESELFGHVRGAFTGAERNRKGLFAEADGGTLLLDEIGEVSARLQVQLLRVLQSGEYRPVGSDRPLHADVRILAATHRELSQMVARGEFRQDLFYRLKVIDIRVPPLRDRAGDIPMLTDRFIRAGAGPAVAIDEDALAVLQTYHWPGNVRELENVIARALALSPGPAVTVHDLPAEIRGDDEHAEAGVGRVRSLSEVEVDYCRRILARCDGNKSQAARVLGIDRKTLQRILSRK